MNTPARVSVIMPVYNVERFVAEAIRSVLAQTYPHFELIIVDDGGSDSSIDICRSFQDARIRIVSQANRGLAGARNTGIAHARGEFVALIDSDDRWAPEKLMMHVIHLRASPSVDVSYAGSQFIGETGQPLTASMRPRLLGVSASHLMKRNPVGNGSAPVIRRSALDRVAFGHPEELGRTCWFDETFRQSEDIELWIRMAAGAGCRFEGIEGQLTEYRMVGGGLSANIVRQFDTWQRAIGKAKSYAPALVRRNERAAAAYQLRYLARRAVQLGDFSFGRSLMMQALVKHPLMVLSEPRKTIETASVALVSRFLPEKLLNAMVSRRLNNAVPA
ncbi:glucosyl transferase [Novosphingobium sp. PC22D]|uniref:glycosyltransferase family 2 protein n=1 Tax=Novosphingobium sp. PC22D TaxID=1962403 RepID=UPI000BF1F169|nr:glycosyltransferase [Novosphingobium sp. PC22D]PEQ10501.1 glucosyl transferase [Novosphingobium sp. PC22D]